VSITKSVYLRVDGIEESRVGEVTGNDLDEIMDNIPKLLRVVADELDFLKVTDEWTPQS
jgi:hypothetical protein